jgi:uncharacterized repeat protein (TIGR01451 family)
MTVRGQAILLSDIVGNGDGSGNAVPGIVGIDPDTGVFQTAPFYGAVTNTGSVLAPVSANPSIDSVFIITQQMMPINAQGVTFQFPFGDVSSGTWNWILKDATHEIGAADADIWCGEIDAFRNGIGIHASSGITFDLDSIRARHGAANVKQLSCFAGHDRCGGPGGGPVNLYAILSNATQVIGSVSRVAVGGNEGAVLELAIPDSALYLTLACGASNGGNIDCDHGVFAEAVIAASSLKSGVRTISAPAGAAVCPAGTADPASVNIRRDGTGTQAVTVTERIFGASTSDVVAQNGGVVSPYIPPASDTETSSGFITAWLLLGPFSRAGGAAPGVSAMRLDYLTDGSSIFDFNVQPRAGDTVNTNFNGAAASTGLAVVTGGINPGAVPTWAQWLDTDDTVHFGDYYGGDVNDIMMYAVCYLRVASSVQVDFCIGSDDAVQVLLDGSEIHLNDVARGVYPSETCSDTIPNVFLSGGIHRIMVKVFEGGGGHAFRLGVFNASTRVPATGVNVCLNPLAPNPCPLGPAGVQITWNTTRNQLNAPGVGYSVDFGTRNLRFRGTIEQRTTLGTSEVALSLPVAEYGPFSNPDFDHAHNIGLHCLGTSVTSPQSGTLTIAGAGTDIWVGGDQFLFAYKPVTGDFSARVTITDRAFVPGSRWGKHGIMARQDCTITSRYSFIHDQGEDLQDATRMANRPTHGGADNFEIVPAAVAPNNHANTLRLDRCGNEFISFVLDETGSFGGGPGDWVEIGRHEWAIDPPETVLVGLAVTSHANCQTTTVTFEDWELFPACDAPVRELSCVTSASGGLDLAWVNPPGADPGGAITIEVNDVVAATLPGSSTTASLPASAFPPGAISTIDVINSSSVAATCSYPPEVNQAGFIETWLILGPLQRPGGPAPGEDQIRRDYLTDGVTTQEGVKPAVGQSILPDYGDLAASTGLAATPGRPDINPGGVPTWFEWNDPDDTIDYFDVFNTDINNVMCHAAAYISVPADTTLDLGIDSDDAIQVLIDGVEVHINNIGRGMLGPNTVVDTVPGIHLTAGRHLILVKVFEGLGGHGFRLRFQDTSLPPDPVVPGRICLDPVACTPAPGPLYLKGDVNNDGWLSMGDAFYILDHMFLGGPGYTCPEAANANGDLSNNLSDVVFLLNFIFLGGPRVGNYPECLNATSTECVYPVPDCKAIDIRDPDPTFRFEFELERIVEGVTSVAARARLRNTEPLSFGIRGWSMSIRAWPYPNCRILGATTDGTLADSASFDVTKEADGPMEADGPEIRGVVSTVVLSFTSVTTLPGGETPHDLLRFSLEGMFVPGECTPCLLDFQDGLAPLVPQGQDPEFRPLPVRNLVHAETRDYRPFSRPVDIRFCPVTAPLLLGGAPVSFSLPLESPTRLFKLAPQPAVGRVIILSLEGADPADRTALYVRWGGAPSPIDFDHAADERGRASQRLVIPFARDAPCYVLVQGNEVAGGEIEATLSAVEVDIALERVSADCGAGGCDGTIHVVAEGAGFDATTTFSLERSPGIVEPALEITILSAERAELMFDVSLLSAGLYDLVAQKGEAGATLPGAVRVASGSIGPRLEVSLDAPAYYREFQLYSMVLRYANTGDREMLAPLFEVVGRALPREENDLVPQGTLLGVADNFGLAQKQLPDFTLASIRGANVLPGPLQLLGIHLKGVAGRLPAGASGEIPILFHHPDPFSQFPGPDERLEFTVRVIDPGSSLTWASLGTPQGMTGQEWAALRSNLVLNYGTNYHEALSEIATRLSRRGDRPWLVRDLLRFAVLSLTSPRAVILGKALGPDKSPLVSQRVGARRNGILERCATTDGEGVFRLGPLADGEYSLLVEGHAIPLTPPVTILDGHDVFPVLLEAVSENGSSLFCPDPPTETQGPSLPVLPGSLLTTRGTASLKPAVAIDPNSKEGPDDLRAEPGELITYKINFENTDVLTSANRVVLIDVLPEDLEIEDLSFVDFTLGVGSHMNVADGGAGGSSNVDRFDVASRLPLTLNYPINDLSVVAHSRATLVRTMDKLKEITLQLCAEDEDDPRGCPDPERAICSCTIQEELAAVADAIQTGKSCVLWILEGHDLEVESATLREVHPLAGLVPPNNEQLRGTGKVRFKVRVSESLMEDETIENNARIVFDTSDGEATRPTDFKVGYRFRRGDANDDGSANLSDALNILNHLFSGADAPGCIDAADANDDGAMNITDPLAILNFLFLGTGELPAPGPYECGFDLTPDLDPLTQLATYNLGCNPGRCSDERRLKEATGSP